MYKQGDEGDDGDEGSSGHGAVVPCPWLAVGGIQGVWHDAAREQLNAEGAISRPRRPRLLVLQHIKIVACWCTSFMVMARVKYDEMSSNQVLVYPGEQ